MPTTQKLAANPLNSCQRLYPSMKISPGSPSAVGTDDQTAFTDLTERAFLIWADRHKRGCLSRSRLPIFTCLPMASLLLTSGISALPAAPVEVKTTIVSDAPKRVRDVHYRPWAGHAGWR